MGIKSGYLMNQ